MTAACPCGGVPAGAPYDDCCGRFHRGDAVPATAEQLMRSRYSAYVRHDVDWLRASWDPATCPPDLDLDDGQTKWLGLTIVDHRETETGAAEVEFVARYKVSGRAFRLHERSRFVRTHGVWRYVDGVIDPAAPAK